MELFPKSQSEAATDMLGRRTLLEHKVMIHTKRGSLTLFANDEDVLNAICDRPGAFKRVPFLGKVKLVRLPSNSEELRPLVKVSGIGGVHATFGSCGWMACNTERSEMVGFFRSSPKAVARAFAEFLIEVQALEAEC